MPTSTSAHATFIAQAVRMLTFWREKTLHVDHEKIKWIESERQNLFHAVQIGLRYPETVAETAVILSQAIPYIIQRGYWQDWIPLLEQCLADKICQSASHRITVLINLGQAYRADSQLDRAIAIHLEAKRLAETTEQNDTLAQIQLELMYDYQLSKAYEEAKISGQSAIKRLEHKKEYESLLANAYKILGTVLFESGEYSAAETYLTKAVAAWRKIGNPVQVARTLNDLSRLFLASASNRYAEAQVCLNEASSLLAPTINERDKCMIYINLGSLYAAQQNWEMAETTFYKANSPFMRQSVALPRKARINNNLGYILFKQGKYEAAEEYLQQALQLWQEIGDDVEYANTLSAFADNLMARLNPAAALPFYDELLRLLEKYPDNHFAKELKKEYATVRAQIKAEIK